MKLGFRLLVFYFLVFLYFSLFIFLLCFEFNVTWKDLITLYTQSRTLFILFSLYANDLSKHKICVIKNMLPERFWIIKKKKSIYLEKSEGSQE